MKRLLRAAKRTLRRIARPLRLRYIDHKAACSQKELQRLSEIRAGILQLENNEHFNLVQLEKRRQEIEKGLG